MASQHPDHASIPYWHNKAFISVQHEHKECYLSYTDFGIDEYKWDWEGKLVDESVMERLLGEHFDYFKVNPLGKSKFLTFRLPNPKVETEFRIGRAFLNILSAAALTKQVGLLTPPLFEVILPMTESAEEIIAIQEAFSEISHLKHSLYRMNGLLRNIEVIPLFEQVSTIIRSDKILDEYIRLCKEKLGAAPKYLRPYVARSDPALNSGLVPTVLAIKIALSHYQKFSERMGIALFPIIGSASLPFRGGLTPDTVDRFIEEYRGVKTALIQSAFRYDFDREKAIGAIKSLDRKLPTGTAKRVTPREEKELQELILDFEKIYRATIEEIAPIINKTASFLPRRRERVLHIGLFGYSRGLGKVTLPRAIGFTGAMYSLGVPPEFIGTGRGIKRAIRDGKKELLEKFYINIKRDLLRAGAFLNKDVLLKLAKKSSAWNEVIEDVKAIEKYLGVEFMPITSEEKEHSMTVSKIYKMLKNDERPTEFLERAAILRRSLG